MMLDILLNSFLSQIMIMKPYNKVHLKCTYILGVE